MLPGRPRPTRTRVLLTCASAALLLFDIALISGGAYLLFGGYWWHKIIGGLLILIGIECRPRFYKLDIAYEAVSKEEAPQLWALVEAVGAAVGAPEIHSLAVTDEFNAWCGRTGVRRRVVLALGLPLWGALSPAGRQALLGHEMGHLVNGDPTTAFTTQPAMTTFGRLAQILEPGALVSRRDPLLTLITAVVAYSVFFPVSRLCRWVHVVLLRIGARDRQRAEAYADALAANLGGSAAVDELIRVLVLADSVATAVGRAASRGAADPDTWRASASQVLALPERAMLVAEQATLRYDASPYAHHPPSGLRLRLARSWPDREAAMPIPVDQFAAADVPLAPYFQRAQRALKNRAVR